jgi:hypothetical protein
MMLKGSGIRGFFDIWVCVRLSRLGLQGSRE